MRRYEVTHRGAADERTNAAPHGEDVGGVDGRGEELGDLSEDLVDVALLRLGELLDGAGDVRRSQERATP